MLYSFEVGQPCPPVVERPRPDFDGAYLEALLVHSRQKPPISKTP